MLIRLVQKEDIPAWQHLRVKLWPQASRPEDVAELWDYFSDDSLATFVAQTDEGQIIGFLEAGIRHYAEDCETSDVGYLEGWFVEEEFRQQRIGAQLVQAAEAWARSKGCREMASDCLLDNTISLAAHEALGYAETSRLIHFVKPL